MVNSAGHLLRLRGRRRPPSNRHLLPGRPIFDGEKLDRPSSRKASCSVLWHALSFSHLTSILQILTLEAIEGTYLHVPDAFSPDRNSGWEVLNARNNLAQALESSLPSHWSFYNLPSAFGYAHYVTAVRSRPEKTSGQIERMNTPPTLLEDISGAASTRFRISYHFRGLRAFSSSIESSHASHVLQFKLNADRSLSR